MKQPHSRRLFIASPSTRGLIFRYILLRGWAGEALDRAILDDHHTLRPLAIYDDWLWNTLLSARRCLPKS